jgi:hypothetical protein
MSVRAASASRIACRAIDASGEEALRM